MKSNGSQMINPNSAEIEELTSLPGVGQELAQRIVQGRPFQTIGDLKRVPGIGTALLERIRPYLSLEAASGEIIEERVAVEDGEDPPPADLGGGNEEGLLPEQISPEIEALEQVKGEDEPIEPDIPAGVETALPVEASEQFVEDAPNEQLADIEAPVSGSVEEVQAEAEPLALSMAEESQAASVEIHEAEAGEVPEPVPAAPARSGGLTCGQIFWIVAASSLVTLLLALALSLGILAGLNGGRLQYAAPSRVNQLNLQIESLRSETELLSQDLTGLRQRLNTLESLSGRVSVVEQNLEEVDASVDQALVQVEALNQEVDQLSAQVETLSIQGERFESFLEGLKGLMDSLLTPEEQSK